MPEDEEASQESAEDTTETDKSNVLEVQSNVYLFLESVIVSQQVRACCSESLKYRFRIQQEQHLEP